MPTQTRMQSRNYVFFAGCFELVLPEAGRNRNAEITDVYAAYAAAWTAFNTDAFLTGPSILDDQSAHAFRAVMGRPAQPPTDPPLSLEAFDQS
jgi:hypothetical protein